MWDSLKRAQTWSGAVIGAAIEVHRIEGPGLIEGIYKKCFGRECELREIPFAGWSLKRRCNPRRTDLTRFSLCGLCDLAVIFESGLAVSQRGNAAAERP
jgi:hypothetical protein